MAYRYGVDYTMASIEPNVFMWRSSNSRFLVFTAICGFCAVGLRASASPPPSASEFYIVSVGFSDALPMWHRSVLEVKPDGSDVLVRYIRVSLQDGCGQGRNIPVILATATRMPDT